MTVVLVSFNSTTEQRNEWRMIEWRIEKEEYSHSPLSIPKIINMSLIDCLIPVVGLSNIDCPCSEEGRPESFNESLSGYFMTDKHGGIPINWIGGNKTKCEENSIWDKMINARRAGVQQFIKDLQAAVLDYNQQKYPSFSGEIGDKASNSYLKTGKFVAMKWVFNQIASEMIINSISIKLSCDADVEVFLLKGEDMETLVTTFNVSSIAGKWVNQELAEPICIQNDTYFLAYELPDNCKPANNKMDCDCGSRIRKYPYFNFIDTNGVSADSFEDLVNGRTHSKQAMGLRLGIDIGCSFKNWLCNLNFKREFTDNTDWQIAETLKLAMSIKLADAIVKTPKVSAFINVSKEVLYGLRKHYQKEYDNNILWFAQHLPTAMSYCFECDKRIFKLPIKA